MASGGVHVIVELTFIVLCHQDRMEVIYDPIISGILDQRANAPIMAIL